MVEGGRAEGLGGLGAVAPGAGGQPNVARVVRPACRSDVVGIEEPLAEREHLARAGAHQHNIDQPLGNDLADQPAVFVEGAEAGLVGVMFGALAGCRKPEGHVGILGVGEDEIAAGAIGEDAGEFLVERFLHWGRAPARSNLGGLQVYTVGEGRFYGECGICGVRGMTNVEIQMTKAAA